MHARKHLKKEKRLNQSIFVKEKNGKIDIKKGRYCFNKLKKSLKNFTKYLKQIKLDTSNNKQPLKEPVKRILHATAEVLEPLLIKINKKR